jgi:uncharacterized Zn ribbon protein
MKTRSWIMAAALVCACASCGTPSTNRAVKEESFQALETAKEWYDKDLLNGDEYQLVKDRLIAGASTGNMKTIQSELVRIQKLYEKDAINGDDANKLREKVIKKYLGHNPSE